MKKPILILACAALCMTACKEKNVTTENPFFTEWETPFGVPPFEDIMTEHYMPAFERGMSDQLAEIDSIVAYRAEPDFDNVILALDNSGELLNKVSNVFFMLTEAVNSPAMQKVEEEISPRLAAHNDKIMLNEGLFAKVKAVYDNRAPLDSLKKRLTEKTYRKFVRSGALLQGEEKERLQKINEQLSNLTFKFGANLLAENGNFVMLLEKDDLTGLPASAVSAAAAEAEKRGEKGKWAFTLDKPSLLPFITYSDRRDLRQKLYEGYLNRANHDNETDNKQIVKDIVALRREKAQLLGFDSHAAFVLEERMAAKPANVYSLLDAIWTPALASAKKDLEEMRKLMAADGLDPEDFQSWDWWFYAEKMRKELYSIDEEALRSYFSLENVKTGIFNLVNRLYGVTFRPVQVPLYHPEAMAYEVLDRDLTHLAVIYMDFHPRPGEKRGGAWCGEFREQSYRDGQRIAPVISIVCNFTRPASKGQPALLSLDETETFFHEFGHAVHGFFSDVPFRGLLNVERDFVELPSQLLENWAFEPKVLRDYATHYSSGSAIPEQLIQKIQNSSTFNQGFITTELVAAALSDMDIHTTQEDIDDLNAFERRILNEERGLIPQIAPRYRFPYFSHIFNGGYSAGYYSYIWSEVLDKDAYQAWVESGDIFSPKVSEAFRREVLSRGGTADGMTLYRNFRGHDPSREPLLRSRGLLN